MSVTRDFRPAYLILFRECFEGIVEGADGTWFVQGKEGLFDAFATVDARQASKKPSPDCNSIAAHTFHILFALQGGNSYAGRPEPEGTWESSWAKQTVTDSEWSELAGRIKDEYDWHMHWVMTNEDWGDPEMTTGVMAQLPHMAYHLGAIRQLMKID